MSNEPSPQDFEVTDEMIAAGLDAYYSHHAIDRLADYKIVEDIFRAMFLAAKVGSGSA
jgi:hypothetical protein